VGIDVSAHQGKIDWQKVKEAGVEFAFIRVGYRGYGQAGKLVADEYAPANLKGAREAGLDVGVYFFSQAINTDEAAEEAKMLLDLIKGYDINLPVVYDWETVFAEDARTNNMQARGITDCALTFCQIIEEAGYTPMVYFNTYQSLNLMHLEELKQYEFWLAWYSDLMRYPYQVRMWQYTDSGRVPGIDTNVDLNVYMTE
jgi:GH25 family lysozyme M1 (1,4-beta-N-acetylmuramidase)